MTQKCETPTGSLAGVSWKSLECTSTDLTTLVAIIHQDVNASCKPSFHSARASTALERGGLRNAV